MPGAAGVLAADRWDCPVCQVFAICKPGRMAPPPDREFRMSEPDSSCCSSGACRGKAVDRFTITRCVVAFFAVLYLFFVALLAAWIGLWNLIGSPSALTIRGWTSEPYDNIFIRAAVWLAACLVLSWIIPHIADRFAARFPPGPPRFLATALVAWIVIAAGQLLWMTFAHFVHAQTDLMFSWRFGELFNNPLVRAVAISLLFTAQETVRIDAAKAKAAEIVAN